MGKALYRQYRSTSFDEVIGQDHITTTLKNALKNNTVSHAYLLTGPRGVGKTSVARILAFEANGLDYHEDSGHMDIIEIDAASNRRIDEIRTLRERVHIAPTLAKYKVYIIDEVHMLTREAFNALLKTLEEPPAHVIFILATTEVHKLPDTIVSRCVRFTFHPIAQPDIVSHLEHIAKKEKIDITKDALKLLSEHGEGSFRDSISLLDQVKNIGKKIELADIEESLGLAPKNTIDAILAAIQSGDPRPLNEQLQVAYLHGASEANIAKQIAEGVRADLMNSTAKLSQKDSLTLLKELLEVPGSAKPKATLELALLQILFKQSPVSVQIAETKVVPALEVSEPVIVDPVPEQLEEDLTPVPQASNSAAVTNEDTFWPEVLTLLKTQNNTIYSIARMASASYFDNTLTLVFKFPFHYKQMNEQKNKNVLTQVAKHLGQEDIMIQITLSPDGSDFLPPEPPAKKTEPDNLSTITNIFGSAEMLE